MEKLQMNLYSYEFLSLICVQLYYILNEISLWSITDNLQYKS